MANMNPPFDQRYYYRLCNAIHAGVSISTGYKHSSYNTVFTPFGSRSSENWQFFQQEGRYFIRNYDYGAELQLGLTSGSSTPQLLPKSGELGQQWMLTDNGDGSWCLINGLGWNSTLLAVSLTAAGVAPRMLSTQDGSERWNITINSSAGGVRLDMLEDVSDLQVRSVICSVISYLAVLDY